MNRLPKISSILSVLVITVANLQSASAVDGFWTQQTFQNQDFTVAGNWLNGVVPGGIDSSAIFNVNLTNDQSIVNVGSQTLGNMFFQDTDTATAGGYNLGAVADVGSITLDVTSGRSIIDVGNLNGVINNKKVSLIDPIINADGILRIGPGQFSFRASCPGMTSDYVAAGGLTDTRSFLSAWTSLQLVGGAQFQFDFVNAAANSVNLLNPAAPVTLGGSVLVPSPVVPPIALPLIPNTPVSGGGTLTISGRSSSANTQVVASVTFNSGSHTINLTTGAGAGSIAVFDPTTFTRNAGAVVNFNTTGTTTNILKSGGLVNDANGIVGGWAIDGTNWAAVSGSTLAPLATYQTSTDPSTWSADQNVSLPGNSIAPIGNKLINTLRVTASSTNNIGSGNVLTLTGLLGTAGVVQFNDGTIQKPAGELIIHQLAGTNLMYSVLGDGISSSVSLIKSGGGVLMLSGTNANTYTGGTFVNQGTLQIGDGFGGGNSSSLGIGPVTLMGSLQILKTNDLTIANSISGSGLLIKQGAGTLTLSGVNTYNGYNLSAPGSTVSGANGSLGFAGTRLDAGTIALASDTALGGVFRFHIANVTLRSSDASTRTVTNNIDDAVSPVTIGAPGTGDLIFTGNMDTGNGSKAFNISNNVTRFNGFLAQGTAPGANTLTKSGPGTLVLGQTANTFTKPFIVTGGTLRISDEGCLGANPPTQVGTQLTLNGGALETTTAMTIDDFNRGITLGTAGGTFNVDPLTTLTSSVSIAGVGGTLIKAGTGTLVLGNFNSYNGSTIINAGTLKLDTSGSISSSGSIVVGSGATFDVSAVSGFTLAGSQSLSGSGTVVGNVIGSGTSAISPGNSPGTLTFNNDLNLAPGDTLIFDLTNNTTIGGGVNDLLVVNGALNLNNNTVTVRPLAVGGALANGTYRLVNYSGTKTGTLTVNSGTRFSLAIDDSIPNQINLQVTGLPASLVWKGNNGSSWDNGTTTNWLNGVNPDVFFNFDTVAFNDTASTFNVSIDATVLPNAMNVNANSDYTFVGIGAVSGVGSINKSGTGKLILGNFGINDYSGGTTINSGSLQIGQNDGSGSIGSGSIVNNGSLRFQNAVNFLNVSNLTGTGTLIAEGLQDLILTTGNTYSGPTIVSTNARLALYATSGSTVASLGNTPTVTVLSDGALYASVAGVYTQALVLNGDGYGGETSGALRGGNVNATWLGPITLASDAFIGNDGSTLIISNSIAGGANNLTKVGVGTLVLAAANTYGTTTINEGPLQLGNGGTIGTLGSGPIIDNWYLAVNRGDDLTISAQISGFGGLLKSGANTLTLTANNTFDGTVAGAPLGTGAAGEVGIRLDAGTIALGSDTAIGTGIIRLNNAGVVLRSSDATTRTIPNTFDVNADFVLGSATTGDLIVNGIVATGNNPKSFIVSNNITTFNGVVQGGNVNNNVTKAGPGTLVLNATNTYGKPTLVSAGTLVVNGVIGPNTVTVASGAFLGGTGAITGPLTVQAGGTLSPGSSIGTLSVSNTLALAGTNIMEVNATLLTSDLVQGLTSVTYGGVLKIVNLSGTLAAGNSFKLFDSQAYAGAFASITPATPGAGLAWDTTSLTVNGTLQVVAAASPPHFNSPVLSGSTLTLSGGGGTPNTPYILLASTNVALGVPGWDHVTTNQFDSSGNFSISMPVTAGVPQQLFLIQLP